MKNIFLGDYEDNGNYIKVELYGDISRTDEVEKSDILEANGCTIERNKLVDTVQHPVRGEVNYHHPLKEVEITQEDIINYYKYKQLNVQL